MNILGIDLAAKEKNPTGICILNTKGFKFDTVFSNKDICELVFTEFPSLIIVDSPLSLPKGRCCLEKDCECAVGGHFRQAEKEIRKYGNVLPLTFKGMKMLTLRGITISSRLKNDFTVIESHPRTSLKVLGYDNFIKLLKPYNVKSNLNEHELDAAVLAITGYLHTNNCSLELGDNEEGTIVIPNKSDCMDLLLRSLHTLLKSGKKIDF